MDRAGHDAPARRAELKLYWVEAAGNFAGGAALIVASSTREAERLASGIRPGGVWTVYWHKPTSVAELLVKIGREEKARVVQHYEMGE